MYDTILLPTDGSAGIERVVDHAGELARVHDATIRALYVVDATSFTGLPMETSWDGVRQVLESEGETALEGVQRLAPEDVAVETVTVEGTPSTEIVRYTRERPVDVVVMGTHGRGGIDRLLLGSVAERVVRKSAVPVVTIPVSESASDSEEVVEADADPAAGLESS
ncbi:universal stress protein [Halosimplex pelagicum]|uniref:Universal stress protein n=1 Tax=Halosimplex pelagicum TaxID=869886 RepID=A0A7D5PEF0_9EURY|nr:universal stress protein [Halosimplex pelagicum]QLH85082.1 universal stress protein [Halosimplex pelagicum]